MCAVSRAGRAVRGGGFARLLSFGCDLVSLSGSQGISPPCPAPRGAEAKTAAHALTASGGGMDTHTHTHATRYGNWDHRDHAQCGGCGVHRGTEIRNMRMCSPSPARPRPPRSRHAHRSAASSEDGRARALAHAGTGRTGVVGGCSVAVLSKGCGAKYGPKAR